MFIYIYKLLYSSISFHDFIIVSIFHCMLKGCDFYFAEITYYFFMNTKFDLCLSLEFRNISLIICFIVILARHILNVHVC